MTQSIKNQLESFVHDWFSDIDKLVQPEVLLPRLDKKFEFNIYGVKLYGHEGFLSIYSGMQDNVQIESRHTASNVEVIQITEEIYQIKFDIALERYQYGHSTGRSESIEEWLVKVTGDKLIIINYAII